MKSTRVAIRPKSGFPRDLRALLRDAVEAYRLSETADWAPLDELSQGTKYEGVTVDADAVVQNESGFVAPGRVYVRLEYDQKAADGISLSDSFPISVRFHLDGEDGHTVVVDGIEVDTTSFYG